MTVYTSCHMNIYGQVIFISMKTFFFKVMVNEEDQPRENTFVV